ncbi:MAG: MarR family transcriptional regulator [Polaromonas sp.]
MTNAPPRLLSPTAFDDLLLYRLSRLLGVAGGLVTRLCEGRYGITRREWRVMAVLAESEGLQSSQLAHRAQLDRARTSKAITTLVGKKLLHRQARPEDRRQVVLSLSDEGRALYAALYPQVIALNRELLTSLTTDAASGLDLALTRLQQKADAVLAQAVLPKANRRQGKRPPQRVESF